jgi:heme exporter protein A
MLSAEGLRHTFGEGRGQVVALDGVSFSLTAGQTLAIFGPNGAGKTTLLKVLAGLIRPQAGSVRIAGGRRAIGWIGHQSHLYEHLTVRENLLFWASLYGVPAARRGSRAAEVLGRLGMGDRADQPVWSLSRGLAQRAAIAKALVHDPSVLLLDEPFTGLDLAAAVELRVLLGELRGGGGGAAGRVLVLATHNVDEGVELATDVAFQRRGRFVHLAPLGGRGPSEIAEAYRRAVGRGGTDG